MKHGTELYKWAQMKAAAAAGSDSELMGSVAWPRVTLAISEAYMQGGIDALADEVTRDRSIDPSSSLDQADGARG